MFSLFIFFTNSFFRSPQMLFVLKKFGFVSTCIVSGVFQSLWNFLQYFQMCFLISLNSNISPCIHAGGFDGLFSINFTSKNFCDIGWTVENYLEPVTTVYICSSFFKLTWFFPFYGKIRMTVCVLWIFCRYSHCFNLFSCFLVKVQYLILWFSQVGQFWSQ